MDAPSDSIVAREGDSSRAIRANLTPTLATNPHMRFPPIIIALGSYPEQTVVGKSFKIAL